MTIDDWLRDATKQLVAADITTARLDAELILAHAFKKDRTWIVAHQNDPLADLPVRVASGGAAPDIVFAMQKNVGADRTSGPVVEADKILRKRLKRIPLAYLLGQKEFYGRTFVVTPDVLIPRPETEKLVEIVLEHRLGGRMLDVGCGSGCIGLTLALETDGTLTLSDTSPAALSVARKNAKALGAKKVGLIRSDLLSHWLSEPSPDPYDVIVANLPYVDHSWGRSPETDYEPQLALFAEDGGLEIIYRLIEQSTALLAPHGHLLLEADPAQHRDLISHAKNHGFRMIENRDYGVLLQLN